MPELSGVSMIVGALLALAGGAMLATPAAVGAYLRRFPRSRMESWILTAIDLAWSGWLILGYLPERFVRLQPAVVILVPVAIYLVVRYMDELLAPRALGGLLLLVPAPILDVARMNDSPWRLVVVVLCYALVVAGLTLVLSPHLFRKAAAGITRSDRCTRGSGAAVLALGLALAALGLAVY